MRATIAIAAAVTLLGVAPAYAGSYVTLPVPNPVTPTSRATPVAGSQNQAADQLLIPSGPALGNGNYAFPSTLTLLASRNTEVFLHLPLRTPRRPPQGAEAHARDRRVGRQPGREG